MTKNELNKIIREIKDTTNERVAKNTNDHIVLTAPVAIQVLKDVFEGVE